MECQEIDQIVWIFKRIDGSKEKDVFAMFATYVAPVTQTMQHITRSRMTADRNASRIDQLGQKAEKRYRQVSIPAAARLSLGTHWIAVPSSIQALDFVLSPPVGGGPIPAAVQRWADP
ncbi:hypothetical protein RB195_009394 [Necator americanus]|uniref:Uncharacterized protein n=1 Tax=Necator americanus TaxID=51031 RepID=A0ABR1CVN6_NECAM